MKSLILNCRSNCSYLNIINLNRNWLNCLIRLLPLLKRTLQLKGLNLIEYKTVASFE